MNRSKSQKPRPRVPILNKKKKSKSKPQKAKNIFESQLVVSGPRRVAAAQSSGVISRCAMMYARAICDPFHPSLRQVCLPAFPSPPSHKTTSFLRFSLTLGTAGYGFASFSPCLASDMCCGYFSNNLYASSSAAVPLTADNTLNVGVSRLQMNNLPYTAANLYNQAITNGQGVAGRIVSYGVKITYTGTTLNESGVSYSWVAPTHENALVAAHTISGISGQPDAEICPTTRKPCTLRIFPVSQPECAYPFSSDLGIVANPIVYSHPYSSNDPYQNAGYRDTSVLVASVQTYVGSPPAVIHLTGVIGSTYLVEIVQHTEYVGVFTASNSTVSDADQRGFEMVTAAAERMPSIIQSTRVSPMSAMHSALREIASALKPVAIGALTKAASAMLL